MRKGKVAGRLAAGLVALLLGCAPVASAQQVADAAMAALGEPRATAATPAAGPPLRVVTVLRPPFVTGGQGNALSGFAVELWQQIARDAQLPHEIVEVATFGELLRAVQERRADVAIANISITAEREAVLDFSQPIFDAGLQIMVRAHDETSSTWGSLFSPALLRLALPALAVVCAVALLMWFFERKHHPFFQKSFKEGWWDAFWWSLQRFASAGFQDVIPRTLPGRLLGIGTSLAALFIVSAFVGTISAAVTVNELRSDIRGVADLFGKRVGTTRGSTAAAYLRQQGIGIKEFDGLVPLFAALQAREVDAVVHDAPLLAYHAATAGRGVAQVVGPLFKEEKYGIALQEGSPLRELINRTLLQLGESGRYDELRLRYFRAREP
jgi:polar amino acid transport system substrate-binding protein